MAKDMISSSLKLLPFVSVFSLLKFPKRMNPAFLLHLSTHLLIPIPYFTCICSYIIFVLTWGILYVIFILHIMEVEASSSFILPVRPYVFLINLSETTVNSKCLFSSPTNSSTSPSTRGWTKDINCPWLPGPLLVPLTEWHTFHLLQINSLQYQLFLCLQLNSHTWSI